MHPKKGEPLQLHVHGRGLVGEIPSTGDVDLDTLASFEYLTERGLLREATKAQRMFNQAVAFAHTAARVQPDILPGTGKPDLAIPFVVNAAFALELYLKTLSHAYGCHQTGHELLDLYKKLPRRAKAALAQEAPRHLLRKQLPIDTPFPDLLKGTNNAFVKWRYLFEKDQGMGELIRFPHVMTAAVILHHVAQEKIWPGTPVTSA